MVGQNENIINYIQHLGETSLTNKLQDISKTHDPSTRSFEGTRYEDWIVCKIGFVLTTTVNALPKPFTVSGPLISACTPLWLSVVFQVVF